MHAKKSSAEKGAEQAAQMQMQLSQDIWDTAKPGFTAAQNMILSQLTNSFGLAPEFVRDAYGRVSSSMNEQYRTGEANAEGALLQRMKQTGLSDTTNPAAIASILGTNRMNMASNLAAAQSQLKLQEANTGLQVTMDLLGKLIGQSSAGLSLGMSGLGQAGGTYSNIAKMHANDLSPFDQFLNFGATGINAAAAGRASNLW